MRTSFHETHCCKHDQNNLIWKYLWGNTGHTNQMCIHMKKHINNNINNKREVMQGIK
jgi:hypothetical protein